MTRQRALLTIELFLFHIGAIKSTRYTKVASRMLNSFYSTLVRLKVHFAASTSFVQKGFYSTLVRLKGNPLQ